MEHGIALSSKPFRSTPIDDRLVLCRLFFFLCCPEETNTVDIGELEHNLLLLFALLFGIGSSAQTEARTGSIGRQKNVSLSPSGDRSFAGRRHKLIVKFPHLLTGRKTKTSICLDGRETIFFRDFLLESWSIPWNSGRSTHGIAVFWGL